MHIKQKAFTLVEMLVVVIIFVILLGILVSSIGDYMTTGYTAACMQNHKGFMPAVTMYSNENRGRIQPFYITSTVSLGTKLWATGWDELIAPYWNGNESFRCPGTNEFKPSKGMTYVSGGIVKIAPLGSFQNDYTVSNIGDVFQIKDEAASGKTRALSSISLDTISLIDCLMTTTTSNTSAPGNTVAPFNATNASFNSIAREKDYVADKISIGNHGNRGTVVSRFEGVAEFVTKDEIIEDEDFGVQGSTYDRGTFRFQLYADLDNSGTKKLVGNGYDGGGMYTHDTIDTVLGDYWTPDFD